MIPKTERRYGISLQRVPVADPGVAINRLLAEKQAAPDRDGKVDLIWINGENFRTGKEAGLFYGPFADQLPSSGLVIDEGPGAAGMDFGVPTDGYESPWSRAQFVFIYDSARVPEPPRSMAALTTWMAANPGRFTYPAPPNFTGSAFLRHVLYEVAGGPAALTGELDMTRYEALEPRVFAMLKGWRPHLWREGRTYPESSSRLHQLFGSGEVWMSMSYGPETAAAKVRDGLFPESTRTFVLDAGTVTNTNYVAIPFNAPHKAAAMAVAELLLSPDAQLAKQRPERWGAMTVLDMQLLSPEQRAAFAAVKRPPALLDPETLAAHALAELHPSWVEQLEKDWLARIARTSQ